MALDTRDRRASAISVGLPWRGLLPVPDAPAEDQGDRQQVGGYYRGVLATPFLALPALLAGAFTAQWAGGGPVAAQAAGAGGIVALAVAGTMTAQRAGSGTAAAQWAGGGPIAPDED